MEVLNRRQIERQFRDRFALLGERQRERAIRLMGDPPDAARIPASFWDDVERENQTAVYLLLLSVFAQSAYEHTLRASNVHPKDVAELRRLVAAGKNPDDLRGAILLKFGGYGAGARTGDTFDPGTGDRTTPAPPDITPGGGGSGFGGPAGQNLDRVAGPPGGPADGLQLPESILLPETLMAGTGLSLAARTWATPLAREVSRGMADTAAKRMAGKTGVNAEETVNRLFGRERGDKLVENEFTRAQSAGGEWTVRRLNLTSDGDIWKNNPGDSSTGPCSVCEALNGTDRTFWSIQFPDGPPAHPNCVCEIIYAEILN